MLHPWPISGWRGLKVEVMPGSQPAVTRQIVGVGEDAVGHRDFCPVNAVHRDQQTGRGERPADVVIVSGGDDDAPIAQRLKPFHMITVQTRVELGPLEDRSGGGPGFAVQHLPGNDAPGDEEKCCDGDYCWSSNSPSAGSGVSLLAFNSGLSLRLLAIGGHFRHRTANAVGTRAESVVSWSPLGCYGTRAINQRAGWGLRDMPVA